MRSEVAHAKQMTKNCLISLFSKTYHSNSIVSQKKIQVFFRFAGKDG